jgi:hypothetical protein
VRFDFIRVNAAEDQQMVVFWQMMQCPYGGIEALVNQPWIQRASGTMVGCSKPAAKFALSKTEPV